MKIQKKDAIALYKKMSLIRHVEETLAGIYPLKEMRTPVHFSIGQEAIASGVCHALKNSDAVFASHRSHAAYLSKGGDLDGMVAEIFGKRTGVAGGRSGSAHLSDNKVNMFSAPILGSYVALACGAALAFKMDKKNNIAAAFFGDAAIEEGVFAESLNFALTKKLPVLFICENNFFSTHIPLNLRQPARPIYKRMAGAGVISARVDGNDAARVFSEASKYIAGIRKGSGPVFLECVTYRYREHVGPNFDFENPYRKRADFDRWIKRCPLACMEKFMLRERYAGADLIRRINEEALGKVRRSIELARKAPWPGHKDLLKDVY